MYDYDYIGTTTTTNSVSNLLIWGIIAAVISIIGGILVYYLFIKPDKKTDNKFLNWFKNFADFKTMLVEPILKITYLVLAFFLTLYSFGLIGTSFLSFILLLTLGNVSLRVLYEISLIVIMIWKNTTELNQKVKK